MAPFLVAATDPCGRRDTFAREAAAREAAALEGWHEVIDTCLDADTRRALHDAMKA